MRAEVDQYDRNAALFARLSHPHRCVI